LLAYQATDSKESADALEQARKLAGVSSPSEQLLVRWVGALKSNYQLGAISSLNDLVAAAPKDKYVLYLAGRWFFDQNKPQRAVKLFEDVLQIDANFTPVLNRLGYAYASMGQLPKAEELMKRYVAAMPNDPNPEDSYGDILFKAGRYDGAQAHFEAALKKDPKFGPSQHELGDVFAMKGDEEAARAAYRKAAAVATNPRRSIEYRSSIGLTYVREANLAQADKEYSALAAEAKAAGYSDLEASLHLTMARYQADDAASLKQLAAAEDAVRGDEHMATAQRDEWMAVIRRWRGMRSMHQGNTGLTEVCLRLLQDKVQDTDNEEVAGEYHALQGAWLANQKKYSEAAAELQETDDVYSLALLAQVKTALGDAAGAAASEKQLLALHEWTIEGVLVVEPARSRGQ
jgi:tetratricopeptide (TPR) repeat protein